MIRVNSPFGKTTAVASTFLVTFGMLPSLAFAETSKHVSNWISSKMPKPQPVILPSKILSAVNRKHLRGAAGTNPYAAGQSKWDVVYQGVNLMSGNYSFSSTDLSFQGGYGIPVNSTRSYSTNNSEEGPLGIGWTMSVDLRSTAGGIIKSSSVTVNTVPINFKERPASQVDPNSVTSDGSASNTSSTSPIQAVTSSGADGQEETIQRDADGILSTPPWDRNKIASTYDTVVGTDGTNYQIMTHNVVNTAEGTVYVYDKQGSYDNGVVSYDGSGASTYQPSNVLKITSSTDRHGNATYYTYDQTPGNVVHFSKSNGATTEHPLTKVTMPNGHEIDFTWGNGGNANRIVSLTDGTRSVQYGYTSGLLTSVTTPGRKITQYGYGSAATGTSYSGPIATSLLSSITNPQGLTTNIYYLMQDTKLGLASSDVGNTAQVAAIRLPSGNFTAFSYNYVIDYNTGTVSHGGNANQIVSSYWTGPTGSYYTGNLFSEGYYGSYSHVAATQQYWSSQGYVQTFEMSGANCTQGAGGGADTIKQYDPASQNLLHQEVDSYVPGPYPGQGHDDWDLVRSRNLLYYSGPNVHEFVSSVKTDTSYNFMGNPLQVVTTETNLNQNYPTGNGPSTRTATTQISYWGASKFYQQRAMLDQAGRFTMKDYYDTSASLGKQGELYKTYEPAFTTFSQDSTSIPVTVPPCPTSKYWKYRLIPQSDTYSTMLDYDSKGRIIDAWKLESNSTSPWTYVRTHTTYGNDGSPTWGSATQVVEDYGGLNRTTSTTSYDAAGRATLVQDAAGKIIHTTFDPDGVIQSIEKIVGSTSTPIVSYSYGMSGITNGQVTGISDNISSVSQSLSYGSTGTAIGQVIGISETNGNDSYSVAYTYNSTMDRATATITTQSALGLASSITWKYSDYQSVGAAANTKRVFQTLTSLDPAGNATPEEFHYAYSHSGKLIQATFAMTPQTWSPAGGATFYDTSHPAATRGRTYYAFDAAGRATGVYNWWDTYNPSTSTYSSSPIRANECSYELTGLNRGLKLQSLFYNVTSGNWNLQRTESYGYDANSDWLTSANYGDGLANQSVSWTYDAAGNRTSDSTNSGSWTYDNLNRVTASPGKVYSWDILGNRLSAGVGNSTDQQCVWDDGGRMTQLYYGSNAVNNYEYRVDGLRVQKESHAGSTISNLTQYRYDGQFGVEDVESTSTNGGVSYSISAINRYAVGPRGLDAISRTTSSGTSVSYPLYDVHGNNIGLLAKSGASWSISDERTYDTWGQVRSGAVTGDQKGRYCASLGHRQDDESGLTYMRSRYYDPASARFISQDKALHGANWYEYAGNSPTSKADFSGKEEIVEVGESMSLSDMMEYIGDQLDVEVYGDIQEISHSTKGVHGPIRDFLLSKGEDPLDWGHFAQDAIGNGPGSGLVKAYIRMNGQIAEAFLELDWDNPVIMHATPYFN